MDEDWRNAFGILMCAEIRDVNVHCIGENSKYVVF